MVQAKLDAAVKSALAAQPGKWRVQFIGSVAEDVWEMCVSGPAVETTEYLDRTLGQLEPEYVANAVRRLTSPS